MARSHRKKYKFTDEILVTDSVISLISGALGLIGILLTGIYSILKKGAVGYTCGAILFCSGILGLLAMFFALFAYRNPDGGLLIKRVCFILALADILIPVVTYLLFRS